MWVKFASMSGLTWSRKLLPKDTYSEGYVANMDAVSFGPYTVNTPPLNSIIASNNRDRDNVTRSRCTMSAVKKKKKRQTIVDQIDEP